MGPAPTPNVTATLGGPSDPSLDSPAQADRLSPSRPSANIVTCARVALINGPVGGEPHVQRRDEVAQLSELALSVHQLVVQSDQRRGIGAVMCGEVGPTLGELAGNRVALGDQHGAKVAPLQRIGGPGVAEHPRFAHRRNVTDPVAVRWESGNQPGPVARRKAPLDSAWPDTIEP